MAEVAERAGATRRSASRRRGASVIRAEQVEAALAARRRPKLVGAGPRRDVDRRLAAARRRSPRSRTSTARSSSPTASRRSAARRSRSTTGASTPPTAARRSASRARPGLSPVTFGAARARGRCARRKTKVQSWYLDVTLLAAVLGRGARLPPHGADLDELRAPRGAAAGRRGRPARRASRGTGGTTRRWPPASRALGLALAAEEGHRLPMLNAVTVPDGRRRGARAGPAPRRATASRSAAGSGR